VRPFINTLLGVGIPLTGLLGCAEPPPQVERVTVAAPDNRDNRLEYARPKPLPDDARLYDRDLPKK
jgi:hypothetical protein